MQPNEIGSNKKKQSELICCSGEFSVSQKSWPRLGIHHCGKSDSVPILNGLLMSGSGWAFSLRSVLRRSLSLEQNEWILLTKQGKNYSKIWSFFMFVDLLQVIVRFSSFLNTNKFVSTLQNGCIDPDKPRSICHIPKKELENGWMHLKCKVCLPLFNKNLYRYRQKHLFLLCILKPYFSAAADIQSPAWSLYLSVLYFPAKKGEEL